MGLNRKGGALSGRRVVGGIYELACVEGGWTEVPLFLGFFTTNIFLAIDYFNYL